ncbi:lipopolysaccharide biosynthesis protein [Pengzhenrongella sicca]|uniref:Lipopolysaccharide biosynthesis protein n=1 Tax=Pengzhenrongella sicca TaxID=2819238 RepID=A0A8A4ZAK8_9MICO|nr:lipopolysaccharide biosynthesis protein [Pengzhenrongella sicca]QTE28904.1 lipopolysaccharide biosynthesis protein [Pengzhenrongella sicca]
MSALSDVAAKGTAVSVGAQLVRFVLQIGSMIVLARLLVPADFGLVAMVTAVIGVAEIVRDLGLSTAAIQARTLSEAERSNLFWANTALGTACAGIALALTPVIVAIYDEPRLSQVVPPLAAVFVLSGLDTQLRADLARSLRFRSLATSDVISQGTGMLAAVLLALAGAGFWALVAQPVVAAFMSLVVNAVNCRWVPGRPRRSVSIRPFLRFGVRLMGTQALSYGTKNIDNIALGAVWGPASLGLYSRAYQLLMTPLNQINTPLTRVAVPILSKLQDDKDTFVRYAGRAQLVGCYVTATMLIVAAALADPLISLLFGDTWEGLAPIFALLALGGVFRSISQLSYWLFLATGRTGSMLRLDVWCQPLMMIVIVAGVPWGPEGVAIGHLVAYSSYWVVSLIAVGRVTGMSVRPLFIKAVTAVGLVGVPSAAAAWGATHLVGPAWAQLAVGCVAAVAVIGLVALVLPVVRRDLAFLLEFLRRAVRR